MPDRVPAPKEAQRYLSRKKIVETENWDDLMHGEHSHAFTVAHSMGAAVLDDIFGLLNDAMGKGESYESFKGKMRQLMDDAGWYGRSDKGPDDKGYINWRTRLIFHTNMRTAFEAGRYRAQLRGAVLRPLWVYKSKVVGKARRQNHLALHDKAFRYDDAFWDTHRPPNGWNCDCSVVSVSESGAARDGVEVLASGPGGPPALTAADGAAVDWRKFTSPEWRYNPGREALAPNFRRYKNLRGMTMSDGRSALRHIVERYRDDMNQTRLTQGEFTRLLDRISSKDYVPVQVHYQVGNLDSKRHEAMVRNAHIDDSKVMAADAALYHGIADKVARQAVPPAMFEALYNTLQGPERIYENTEPRAPKHGREFHFVTSTGDGQAITVVLRQRSANTALRVATLGLVNDHHSDERYERIW